MTEVQKGNLQCPHCGSEEVEQYATADTAKFHEEVKARDNLIPNPPQKIHLRFFLIPLTLIGIGVLMLFKAPMITIYPPYAFSMVIGVPLTLIAFLISLAYNALGYPSRARWYDTYICYCCGQSFRRSLVDEKIEQSEADKSRFGDEAPKRNIEPPEPSLPTTWFILKDKLVKLLAFYGFAIIAIRFMGLIMSSVGRNPSFSGIFRLGGVLRNVSLSESFLFRQEIFSTQRFGMLSEFSIRHIIFYMIPIAGFLWLLKKRKSGAALIFAGTIGLVGFFDHGGSFLYSVYFLLRSLFRGSFMFLGFWTLLSLALKLGFAFMAYKIFRISKSLYGENFYKD